MFTPVCKKGGLKECSCGMRHRLQWAFSCVFHSLSICSPEYSSSLQGRPPSVPCSSVFNPKSRMYGWYTVSLSGLSIKRTLGNGPRTIRIQTPIQKGRGDKCTAVCSAWHWRTVLYLTWIVFSISSYRSFKQQTGGRGYFLSANLRPYHYWALEIFWGA